MAIKNAPQYKWLIRSGDELSDEERRDYWEDTHQNLNYNDTWSMTEDPVMQQKILDALADLPKNAKILIPGCGSRTSLQQTLLDNIKDVKKITCTDFKGVITVAKERLSHPRLKYQAADSKNLGAENQYDAVIIVNAVVSDDDAENREILSSCLNALKPGGKLVAFFPTVFCALDLRHTGQLDWLEPLIDLSHSRVHEPHQDIKQIFYSPLQLRHILKEAGYQIDTMEIFFCDSDTLKAESEKHYGLKDPDLVIYEHFVKASKPKKPSGQKSKTPKPGR